MHISSLHIYPVKSLGGAMLETASVTPQGLLGDRVWLIATPEGEMVTARKFGHLLLWQTEYNALSGSLNIVFDDGGCLKTERDLFRQRADVQVWKDKFCAWHGDGAANEMLSQKLGFSVRLYYLGDESARRLPEHNIPLTFADGAPFLLTNMASLDDLNIALGANLEMARFRANVVVSGCQPYEEETWQRVQMGEVVFDILKPCVRCVMPTIDLRTGEKDVAQQPLQYLAQHRETIFGMNVVALNQGQLRVGDEVKVLRTIFD
ncbi:MOSC domain-containing protein [Neisseriaceae bacterium B1]